MCKNENKKKLKTTTKIQKQIMKTLRKKPKN